MAKKEVKCMERKHKDILNYKVKQILDASCSWHSTVISTIFLFEDYSKKRTGFTAYQSNTSEIKM